MVKLVVMLTPRYEELRTTVMGALTIPAETKNVAVDDPCGTVIAAGTLAPAEFELERATTAPPAAAAAVRLTVPVAD
jgi:hypothetical protein